MVIIAALQWFLASHVVTFPFIIKTAPMTAPHVPLFPLASYAGKTIGPYTWYAFDPASGLHYLRTPYPEKWIRLTDKQWQKDNHEFALAHFWYDVPGDVAHRAVVPIVHLSKRIKPQRKKRRFDVITKP